MNQKDFQVESVSKVQISQNKPNSLTPNFDAIFGKLETNGNEYHCFRPDFNSLIDQNTYKYNIIHFPLIGGLYRIDSNSEINDNNKIGNEKTVIFPIVVNVEGFESQNSAATHICETGNDSAGFCNCASLLYSGEPQFFKKMIKEKKEFGLPQFMTDFGLGNYYGEFFVLPVLLNNLSVCYLVTQDERAPKKLNALIAEQKRYFKEIYVGIDNPIFSIDKWRTLINIFKCDNAGDLVGIKIIGVPLNK